MSFEIILCADGSSPCKNGIDDSGTTPHCAPAPSTDSATPPNPTCGAADSANTSDCIPFTADPAATCNTSGIECSGIFTKFVDPLIKFVTIGVGVIVVIVIIIGGIQYATSGGNPQATANARKKIFNAILALVVFALLYALLNWLVPGGIQAP